jgi:hypothetical protein
MSKLATDNRYAAIEHALLKTCGCGNPKDESAIVCRTCWGEVPGAIKRQLSDTSRRVASDIARRQIEIFATRRISAKSLRERQVA